MSAVKKCVCGALLLLIGVVSAAQAMPPVSDDDLFILQVRMSRYILSDATIAYRVGRDEYCIVLEDLLDAVEADYTITESGLGGWFGNEANTFSIDTDANEITAHGRTHDIRDKVLYSAYGQICIETKEAARWLSLSIRVDAPGATLWLSSDITLPVESRFRRKQQRSGLHSRKALTVDPLAHDVEPFEWISWPIVDYSVAGRLRADMHATGSVLAIGEALKSTATLNAQLSSSGGIDDIRLSLGRIDPNGNLFGPLRASELSVGYIATEATRFSTSARAGNGLFLSSFDVRRATQFDQTTLRGDVQSGWEVELYQNGVLVDFTVGTDRGEWVFDRVPLVYGSNDFRIEYYGPQGQRRTEHRQSFIGDRQVAPGTFDYRLSLLEASDGGLRGAVGLEAGLATWLSASVAATTYGETEQQTFFDIGLQASLAGMGVNSDISFDGDGGYAIGTSLHARIWGGNVFITSDWLSNYRSEVFPSTGSSLHFLEARATTSFTVLDDFVIPLSLSVQRESRDTGQVRTTGNLRMSIAPAGLIVTNDINYQNDTSAAGDKLNISHTALFNYRMSWGSLRGEIQSNLYPVADFSSVNASVESRIREKIGVRVGASMDPESREISFDASIRHQFANSALALQLTRTKDQSTLGINLSGSILRNPSNGRWATSPQGLAKSGAIFAEAYLDENYDNIRNESETLIPDAAWKADGRNRPSLSSVSGKSLIAGGSTYQPTKLEIDMSALDEPYLMGPVDGEVVVMRPGKVMTVAAPLVLTGEIVGDVVVAKCNGDYSAADVSLVLNSLKTGETIARTSSEFDGFFVFDRVPYGDYELDLDEEQAARTGLRLDATPKIRISTERDFVTGVNLVVVPAKRLACPSSTSAPAR